MNKKTIVFGVTKSRANRKMQEILDSIPYGEISEISKNEIHLINGDYYKAINGDNRVTELKCDYVIIDDTASKYVVQLIKSQLNERDAGSVEERCSFFGDDDRELGESKDFDLIEKLESQLPILYEDLEAAIFIGEYEEYMPLLHSIEKIMQIVKDIRRNYI